MGVVVVVVVVVVEALAPGATALAEGVGAGTGVEVPEGTVLLGGSTGVSLLISAFPDSIHSAFTSFSFAP